MEKLDKAKHRAETRREERKKGIKIKQRRRERRGGEARQTREKERGGERGRKEKGKKAIEGQEKRRS